MILVANFLVCAKCAEPKVPWGFGVPAENNRKPSVIHSKLTDIVAIMETW